jgi:diadenosine tetraphosphatase ApaH/serine/threonine PP2A family protein phosphatase
MKYGILGDVHANLSALQTALAGMDAEGVEEVISVGDVVGYGAAPKECIRLLQERDATVVLGNHDAAVAEILDDMHFNPYARAAVAWTRTALDSAELQWLRALPLTATLDEVQVSHGTLHRPELFNYILSLTDADPSLDIMERPVCFVGHSHIPLTVMRFADAPTRTAYTFDPDVDLSETERALINVGSVGQPRDEDPRTAYLIYDSATRFASLKRSTYDIEHETERIRAAGLPDVLAERLHLGL